MPTIPVSYSDADPSSADPASAETTMVSFCEDPDGRFTGALMPMVNPIDTESQWQSLIEGLISNAIIIDPEANLDGLYSFSWWADVKEPAHSGMLFTRMSDEAESDSLNGYRLPTGTLGLFSLATRSTSKEKIGALAISGYVSVGTGRLRGDRILGTIISATGEVLSKEMADSDRDEILIIGDRLTELLNQGIRMRQDI